MEEKSQFYPNKKVNIIVLGVKMGFWSLHCVKTTDIFCYIEVTMTIMENPSTVWIPQQPKATVL